MAPAPRYSWFVLLILGLIYMQQQWSRYSLNYLYNVSADDDFTSIQAADSLSYADYGILTGYGFSATFCLAGLVAGRAADVSSRKLIIFAGCLIWNAALFMIGYSKTYAEVLLWRLALGFGQAFSNPASYSLIADYFPEAQRAQANGLFACGVHRGGGAGGGGGGGRGRARRRPGTARGRAGRRRPRVALHLHGDEPRVARRVLPHRRARLRPRRARGPRRRRAGPRRRQARRRRRRRAGAGPAEEDVQAGARRHLRQPPRRPRLRGEQPPLHGRLRDRAAAARPPRRPPAGPRACRPPQAGYLPTFYGVVFPGYDDEYSYINAYVVATGGFLSARPAPARGPRRAGPRGQAPNRARAPRRLVARGHGGGQVARRRAPRAHVPPRVRLCGIRVFNPTSM